MSRNRITPHEIIANQQPTRTAAAHRLAEASIAAWANDTLLAVEMVKQADGIRRTGDMTWPELLCVDEYSRIAATTTATATAE